jgi:hypothetical protein
LRVHGIVAEALEQLEGGDADFEKEVIEQETQRAMRLRGGFVTGTLIDSQRHVRTVLAYAAVAVLPVANASPLRMRWVFRDVRWRCVLKVSWTAA